MTSASHVTSFIVTALLLPDWQITSNVVVRLIREKVNNVHGQVDDDHQDLDKVRANVDVVNDAAAFEGDANFVSLTPARYCVSRGHGVDHVLSDVGIYKM